MRINQKIIMGFLVVALLILAVSYIGMMTQKNMAGRCRKVAGEVLPGTISAAMIQVELHHAVQHMEQYGSSGNIRDREQTEETLLALEEYVATHRLYHTGHDVSSHIGMIDETVETVISFIMEYILLKDKGGSKEEIGVVRAKIDRAVNGFKLQVEPRIREHLKDARETIKTTEQSVTRARKLIFGSSAVIFALALVLGFFISRFISKPIRELTEAAVRIGKGKLDAKIEIESKDEIGELAISFNKMARDLQKITVSRDEFAQEVAEREKATEALLKSEEKLAGIVESVTDAMIMVDEQFTVMWTNDIADRVFGSNLVGKKCYRAYHGRDKVCEPCIVKECFEDGKAHEFETEITSADGDRMSLWCAASVAARDEDGRPKMVVEFLRDITDRKQVQREIETLKQQIEFILGATKTGLDIIDSEFNIRYIDPEWKKVYGDPAGKKCYEYFMDQSEVCPGCGIVKAMETKTPIVTEEVLVKEGNRPIQVTTIPFQNDEGEWLVAEVNVDISERKRAEKMQQAAYDQAIIYAGQLNEEIEERKQAEEEKEKLEAQLLQAQKMEAIGTLAGGISHDFNNILQGISGYTQLLLMQKGVDDPDSRYLNQIDKLIQRARELTQQLLTFSRKVESSLRPVDLNQEVMQVHDVLKRTIPKMIDIELHLAEDLKLINADPVQLEQIMMNLGVNAKDAMPDGGKLIFQTEDTVLDKEYCATHLGATPGEYVQLTISDTGHGMDKEAVQRIFEPFYTTKEIGKGTGLGLAMVYGIVKTHGGFISCYSEPGQGTVFRIYFPGLEAESREKIAESKEEEEIIGGSETILLVDDEQTLLDIGKDMLNRYGYMTITAENGERAIEIYKLEKDRIHLVVLDVGMPGIGGYKCLQELLKIDPEIKVIIATGYPKDAKVKEILESGAAGFVGKPYRLVDMLKKVREVLDQE